MDHLTTITHPPSQLLFPHPKLPLLRVTPPRISKMSQISLGGKRRIVGQKNVWSRNDSMHYVRFLKDNFDLFYRTQEEKRIAKIYLLMEQSIGSKNYAQCRIHHTRMTLKYGTTQRIIQALQRKLSGQPKMEDYRGLLVQLEEYGEQGVEEGQLWALMKEQCWTNYPQINAP